MNNSLSDGGISMNKSLNHLVYIPIENTDTFINNFNNNIVSRSLKNPVKRQENYLVRPQIVNKLAYMLAYFILQTSLKSY